MTISQIVYQYIKELASDPFYYIENDYNSKQPYNTMYLLDDPKERFNICLSDEGQAMFAFDNFSTVAPDGIDSREEMIDLVKGIEQQTINGFYIRYVDINSVADRSRTINGLMQFSFNATIHYEES